MASPEKLAILRRPARWGKAAMWISVLLPSTLALGCSADSLGVREPEQVAQQAQPRAFIAEAIGASGSSNVPGSAPIQLAAHDEPGRPSPNERTSNSGKKEGNGHGKKEADENKNESPQPKQKITLPMAIEMCINNNFRVLAGAERIRMAEADLVTSSLIPNPSLFADCQLIPL